MDQICPPWPLLGVKELRVSQNNPQSSTNLVRTMVIFHHIMVVRFFRATNEIYIRVSFSFNSFQNYPIQHPENRRLSDAPLLITAPPTHRCEDVNQTMELERWKWGGVFLQHNNNSKQAKQESGCPEKTSDSSRECVYLWEASTAAAAAAAAILMGMRERERESPENWLWKFPKKELYPRRSALWI